MQTEMFDMTAWDTDKCDTADVKIGKHEALGIETTKMNHGDKGKFRKNRKQKTASVRYGTITSG